MNYIQYKQWADHWESLQHQAIDSSLENNDELDDTDEVSEANAVMFLAFAICLLSFIIAIIISA